jgi:hypothetical protein
LVLEWFATTFDEDTLLGVYGVLYADAIHLNPVPHTAPMLGIFISGSTVSSAISGKSPVGMSGTDYGLNDVTDAALIQAIQETIWSVVSKTVE